MLFSRTLDNRLLSLAFVAAVLCLFWAGNASAGDPFSFSGGWDYQKNGGGDSDSSKFVENYNMIYSKELTAAMGFSSSVRYSKSEPSDGATTSAISPTVSFDLRNDLFALSLNASETQNSRSGSPTQINDTWGFNLNTNVEDWPTFRLYYSQSASSDDADSHLTDNESKSLGGSIEHSFERIDLLYDVRTSQSTNNLTRSENENFDQSAQISYQQTFLQGRLSFSASQQYQVTESDQSRVVGAGSTVPVELFFSPSQQTRFYEVDNDPVNAALGTGTFQGVDLLNTTLRQNMSRFVNGQSYDLIEVFLYQNDAVTGKSALSLSQLVQITGANAWTVYSKNSLALPWQSTVVARNIENSRTIVEPDGTLSSRTVIRLALPAVQSSTYVKVVADVNTFSVPALVDDILVYRNVISADDIFKQSTKTTNLQTQLNTMFRVTDNWSISYSMRRAETQLEDGDTVQLSQSLTNTYNPSEKLGFSLGLSQNVDQDLNGTENLRRSYSFSMSMLPIPTINLSFGYSRSENEPGDGEKSVSDAVSSTINTSIYPDLSASLTTNWSQSQVSGEDGKSDTYGINAYTTAYLTPRLDLTTNLGYSESNSTEGTTTTTSNYGVNLGFRPSDILLTNFSANGDFEGESTAFSSTASLLWTRKLQSQFGFTYDLGEEQSQQYNTQLSWAINKSLSLKAVANFAESAGEETWNFNVNTSLFF